MDNAADLELGLHRSDKDDFIVELRFRGVGAVDMPPIRGKANIEVVPLRAIRAEDAAYGEKLFEQLFTSREVLDYFDKALVAAATADVPLRLRLFIGPTALPLHDLRWELLRDKRTHKSLLAGENVLFSRYLSSQDWRPVQLRPQESLSALVVVANPTDLNDYEMSEVRVAEEVARAKASLGLGTPVDVVLGPDTLPRMMDKLHNEYDILYLVCHGGLDQMTNEPRLWLEGEKGTSSVTAGGELVSRLVDLWHRPRLVLLASCQSAGRGEEIRSPDASGVLAAIGPKLAAAGLPAVLAMQGSISMKSVELFMPVFFRELRHHGRIDQAMAVARGALTDAGRPDHWMPVLFSRISHGRIWYVPGETPGTGEAFDGWSGLLQAIDEGACTPILGSGMLDGVIGSTRELAHRWADKEDFAMAAHQRENLPQVAQYLSVMQSPSYPSKELEKRLRAEISRRFGRQAEKASIDDLLEAARAHRREQAGAGSSDPSSGDIYAILARLPFKSYITTNTDDQLRRELVKVGKTPCVELCRWHARPDFEWPESVFDGNRNFTPDNDGNPLIYHLYGQLKRPESLVLTEDDYFDYLIGINKDANRVPLGVKKTLVRTALLFLGFRMDEWDFRVLFRSILSQGETGRLSKNFKHIALQIEPEEGRNANPYKARRYLQDYFRTSDIHIYWGHLEDFARELGHRWEAARAEKAEEVLV